MAATEAERAASLDAIRERLAEEVAPPRQRVRSGELSQRDFDPLLEEAFRRAEERAATDGVAPWELYSSILGDRSMHWADRRLAANRLHDPAVVPASAAPRIAPVIEAVLLDPQTRYNLMLHTVMAASIVRARDPVSALYPVPRETIDAAVVPYVEQGLPGGNGYEEQMRNLRHSMHLLATVARLATIHPDAAGTSGARGTSYASLLAGQLDRVITLYEANREAMISPDVLAAEPAGPDAREIDFEPMHLMEHLAEAMEEVARSSDARLVGLVAGRDVAATFERLEAVSRSFGRTPARIEEYRGQVASFRAAVDSLG
ncbi:MAG: hypothetical protein F4150_06210 [Chloroflexi bacterium]|nr:hypothetical protein [Chloroflexota bacterium]